MLTNIEASELSFFLSFLVSIILSFGFYLKDKSLSETASLFKYTLMTSRFFVLFIIIFLLFNPLFTTNKEVSNPPKLICLVDNSESMMLNDSLIDVSVHEKLLQLKNRVSSKAELEIFTFGNQLKKTDSLDFKGGSTDILEAISKLSELELNKNISGLVLLSDGIITNGGVELFNPMSTPVYSIGFGDTAQIRDAIVKKVYHNDISYSGNEFPVEIICAFKKMQSIKQRLSVHYAGKVVLDTQVVILNNNSTFKHTILIKAEEPGMKKITVSIGNNIEEKITVNNSIQRYINILDSKQKIAFVYDVPHPDVRALKSVFYGEESFSISDYKFNDSCPDLSQFNAVVFIGSSSQKQMDRWSMACQLEHIGKLWITGVSGSFSSRDMGLERLDESKDEAYLSVNDKFSLFKLDDRMKQFLNEAPPISIPFGKWRLSNLSQTLASQNIGGVVTNYPLITFSSSENVKSGYILGEGIWRWKLQEKGEFNEFSAFFKKILQYLSATEDKSAFRLKYNKVCSNIENVIIESEFYNPSYELDNSETVSLELENESGKVLNFEFLKIAKKYRIDLGVLKSGVYKLTAKRKVGSKTVIKSGKLLVESKSIESLNLQANYNGLKKLSASSFGKFYYENQFNVFLDDISSQENFKTLTYIESVKEQLLKNKWILFLIIALLGAEWFLRKWEGVI